MQNGTPEKRRYTALITAAALAACAAAAFFAVWFPFQKRLLRSRNYAQAAPAALEAGRIAEALDTAWLASRRDPLDPGALYWYARALDAAEKTGKANAVREQLFAIDREKNPAFDGVNTEEAPPFLPTEKPWFHSRARIDYGRTFYEGGDYLRAAAAFENACAFGQTPPPESHPMLFDTFRRTGAWGRAFRYTTREAGAALDQLPREALLVITRTFAAEGNWDQCQAMAEMAARIHGEDPESLFWLGRAQLALENSDAARQALRKAAARAHPGACWYLGLSLLDIAPGEALQSFLRTPAESIYRPFSLAMALNLLNSETAAPPVDTEKIRAELHERILETPEIPVFSQQESGGYQLAGLEIPPETRIGNRIFSLLIYWAGPRPEVQGGGASLRVIFGWKQQPILFYGNRILEVRQSHNLLPWSDFELLREGQTRVPGWPSKYRVNRDTGRETPFRVVREQETMCLQCESGNGEGVAMLSTVRIPVEPQRFYLFAARCRSANARLAAGWQWYNADDIRIDGNNVFNQDLAPAWQWRAQYRMPPRDAAYVSATAGIFRDSGAALFDTLILIPLDPLRETRPPDAPGPEEPPEEP
jgi:tetratricopeptide (TPR) repeat protein